MVFSGFFEFAIGITATTLLMGVTISVKALYHYKRNTPTNFWSGSTIKSEEITDIPAYNRAVFLMLTIFLIGLAIAGAVIFFSFLIGFIAYTVVLIVGTAVMIKVYKQIYNKYKSALGLYRIEI